MLQDFARTADRLTKGLPVNNQELNLILSLCSFSKLATAWGSITQHCLSMTKGQRSGSEERAQYRDGRQCEDCAEAHPLSQAAHKCNYCKRSTNIQMELPGWKMKRFWTDRLANQYGFRNLTATRVRATEAARKLSHQVQLLVCKQIWHSANTSAVYYEVT